MMLDEMLLNLLGLCFNSCKFIGDFVTTNFVLKLRQHPTLFQRTFPTLYIVLQTKLLSLLKNGNKSECLLLNQRDSLED